jgi:arogenate dehydrogenase (NADP+)
LDAAQPFDYESRKLREQQARERQLVSTSEDSRNDNNGANNNGTPKLKIGIVGFGTFGQFLARRMRSQGHTVIATSRSPRYLDIAQRMGVKYFESVDDFCEEHPEVVVLSTSILSTEKVLSNFPFLRLRRNTLMVDVLSVKEFPKRLMLRTLPKDFDILCTHPMFGPDSGKNSWEGLPLMYDQVRVNEENSANVDRCENFLNIFRHEGCRMIPMSCEEHDIEAASTQFITHTVGRMLGDMRLESSQINTKGYESLLNLIDNTCNDSFELYYGLFMYNQNSTEVLEAMERSFDRTKKKLFDQLHEVLREQLFGESQPEHIREQQEQKREQESNK